jgi:hypothetical protein
VNVCSLVVLSGLQILVAGVQLVDDACLPRVDGDRVPTPRGGHTIARLTVLKHNASCDHS